MRTETQIRKDLAEYRDWLLDVLDDPDYGNYIELPDLIQRLNEILGDADDPT